MRSIWRRVELHSLLFYLRPRDCKDRTKEQEDKGLKAEGWGLIPHCQGHFEIKDGRIIPTKGSLTCAVPPSGSCRYWPASAFCVADGRRKGPNVSSWSRRWNPCSRWRLQQHLCTVQMCVRYHKPKYRPARQKINFKGPTWGCVITRSSLLFPGSIREQKCAFVSDSGSAKSLIERWSEVLQGLAPFRAHGQMCRPGNLDRFGQREIKRSH